MWLKFWRVIQCRWRGHQWYEWRDYNTFYARSSIPLQMRSCQHCGKREVAVYEDSEEIWVNTKQIGRMAV